MRFDVTFTGDVDTPGRVEVEFERGALAGGHQPLVFLAAAISSIAGRSISADELQRAAVKLSASWECLRITVTGSSVRATGFTKQRPSSIGISGVGSHTMH